MNTPLHSPSFKILLKVERLIKYILQDQSDIVLLKSESQQRLKAINLFFLKSHSLVNKNIATCLLPQDLEGKVSWRTCRYFVLKLQYLCWQDLPETIQENLNFQ